MGPVSNFKNIYLQYKINKLSFAKNGSEIDVIKIKCIQL